MTAPAPVPDGTTPPAEAVEAVMKALGCFKVEREVPKAGLLRHLPPVYCASKGHVGWTDEGCPVAVSVAAAVVAALRLPDRDRETAAKALDEVADEWQRGDGFTVMTPKGIGIPAIDYAQRTLDWLRARASALREGGDR